MLLYPHLTQRERSRSGHLWLQACVEAEVPVTTHQETGSDAVQLRGKRALATEEASAAGRRA